MVVVHLIRKPLSEGNVASNVLKWGTGALNVDVSRIGTTKRVPGGLSRTSGASLCGSVDGSLRRETGKESGHNPNVGRWPANLILSHLPGCVCQGTMRVQAQRGGGGVKKPGNRGTSHGVYGSFEGKDFQGVITKGDADGMEAIEDWDCAEGCPVRGMDDQSGNRPVSGAARTGRPATAGGTGNEVTGIMQSIPGNGTLHNDSGGASRFFKQVQG